MWLVKNYTSIKNGNSHLETSFCQIMSKLVHIILDNYRLKTITMICFFTIICHNWHNVRICNYSIYSIPRSSTSKIRVEFAGIGPTVAEP